MQTFKLLDFVHYERNEPGEPQIVYFDLPAQFHYELQVVLEETDAKLNEEKVEDMATGLSRLAKAVEEAFGPLTLPQLLYVVHLISARMNYYRGLEAGYSNGVEDTLNELKLQADATLTGQRQPNKWGTNTGTA